MHTITGRPTFGLAVALVLIGIASVQLGAGFAKLLFDDIGPNAVVWLRLATSSIVLLVWARPRLSGRSRADWWVAAWYGACLGTMNWAIYQSFSRIPIGIAVTIEFIGPLTIAAIGFRRARDLGWVVLAAIGVLLSVEPAAAALVGLLVVGEELAAVQWLAIGFVVVASIGATRATRTNAVPVDVPQPPAS